MRKNRQKLSNFETKTLSELKEMQPPAYIPLFTENRLNNKPSKKDIQISNQRLINDDNNHRCVSYPGEIKFDNYLRIDNSNIEAEDVAKIIKEKFNL